MGRMKEIQKIYEVAKQHYAKLGLDTNGALEELSRIAIGRKSFRYRTVCD